MIVLALTAALLILPGGQPAQPTAFDAFACKGLGNRLADRLAEAAKAAGDPTMERDSLAARVVAEAADEWIKTKTREGRLDAQTLADVNARMGPHLQAVIARGNDGVYAEIERCAVLFIS